MLPTALGYGVSVEQYWDMTVDEINMFLEGKMDYEKRQMQNRAIMDWTQSNLLMSQLSNMMSSKKDRQEIDFYDFYGELFPEENARRLKAKEEYEQVKVVENYKAWAKAVNKARRKERGES